MLKNLKENLINLVTSRLFVLVIAFSLLFGLLIHRVFVLQIIEGETHLNNFILQIRKERSIPSTRGKIYDRNGKLLADNELAYSVTIEDVYESGKTKNAELNSAIYRLIGYIEKNNDKIISDFNIILDKDNHYQFAVSDKQLLRFLADVYGHSSTDDLEYKEATATPEEVVNYLAREKRYGVGGYEETGQGKEFKVGLGYTKEEMLKILTVRYAMSANSYQKYIPTVVASDVSEKTVAVVMENADSLNGVAISEETVRKYTDSVYFSHIIGYIGKISQEELTELNPSEEELENSEAKARYSLNDMVGKAGIEQYMETDLQGIKGTEVLDVNNLGKVIATSDRVEPIAGNDVYLTIDADLQRASYDILEQKIAGILYSKIRNIKEYTPSENASASNIVIPIYDVYFALINNNILDAAHFKEKGARETEQAAQAAFESKEEAVFATLKEELFNTKTPYNQLPIEYQAYESYIVSMLSDKTRNVIREDLVDQQDATVQAWKTEETISLHEYLNYMIAKNWIDVTKLNMESQYSDSAEIYSNLVDYIISQLNDNTEFSKKLYKYMIQQDILTGKQICQLLCEQNIIDVSEEKETKLRNGGTTAYAFMLDCIQTLEITPAQLALDPCSGSTVVVAPDTGEVLALVTYPGYDINRLTNTIDADYYARLKEDLSNPMWNYATQQLSAPGSTFKMVSATAGLEEGVITTGEKINCLGTFDKIDPTKPPRCWIASSGTHGPLNVSGGIENSCNYYFYEVGYRLGTVNGVYDSDYGVKRLGKYADLYGLSETSGIEITESEPQISDMDAVRSAIGQGTNNYTTVGLARYVATVANSGTCYNLSLMDKLTDSKGNLLQDYTPSVRNHIDAAPSTWSSIHQGMRKVVEGKKYYEGLGVNVAGKTGTAQESRKRANHALFVGYAPYENPEIAIATRIAFGYVSDYAAETTRDIIKYYFDLEDESELLSGTASTPDATGNGGD